MVERRTGRAGRLAGVIAGIALGALAMQSVPAHAQMYLGWDFGNGFGIGIGPVPSAYSRCPT